MSEPAFEDKCRVAARHYYVKTHAPTLFAGMLSNSAETGGIDALRAQAIEQAGLLFDELEPK